MSKALEIAEAIINLVNEGRNLNALIDRAEKGNYLQRKKLADKYDDVADWTRDLKYPDPHIEKIRQKEGKAKAGAEILKDESKKIPDSQEYKVKKRGTGKANPFMPQTTSNIKVNIGNAHVTPSEIGDYASDDLQKNKAIGRHYRKLTKKGIHEALQLAEAIVAAASPDDEFHNYKSIRRNAEKEAKKHGYNAKQYERRSIKAEEDGRERRAEYLYDKANSEWDKETAQQQRAADAHRKVEDMRFKRRKGMDEALQLVEAILAESNPEVIQRVANKRAYDAGYHSQKQFNDGEVTPEGKKAQKKFAKMKDLIRKRENRIGDWAVKHSQLADSCHKGWEDSKNEALQLAEAICDFADNLFELDYEQKQDISPNKIKRTKKDKDGEKVEVVSVADELFPYEGTAKQQFNQKILAKINDMIEGTGSLEDLIQFVRAGAKGKKAANEGYEKAEGILEEVINEVSKRKVNDVDYKRARAQAQCGKDLVDARNVLRNDPDNEELQKKFEEAEATLDAANKKRDKFKKTEAKWEASKKKRENGSNDGEQQT